MSTMPLPLLTALAGPSPLAARTTPAASRAVPLQRAMISSSSARGSADATRAYRSQSLSSAACRHNSPHSARWGGRPRSAAVDSSAGAGAGADYDMLQAAVVVDPTDGSSSSPLDGTSPGCVVVFLGQLGDFSSEYVELLLAAKDSLADAGLGLRVIGIGGESSAQKFCDFSGLAMGDLRLDPDASAHRALDLYAGPGFEVPEPINDALPEGLRGPASGWLNYMAMCAGVGSSGTIEEIARGYLGDRNAPERIRESERVEAGPISVTGTRKWGVGPVEMDLWWGQEAGYQRPVELATVRLRSMVEALSHWDTYVPDQSHLAQRGGTFIAKDGAVEYAWRDQGVLNYSATMARPLTFLEPYIGPRALNPLGLGDPAGAAPVEVSAEVADAKSE